jgi:outer membrane protein assembly factor BamD (BamD/ComL family)
MRYSAIFLVIFVFCLTSKLGLGNDSLDGAYKSYLLGDYSNSLCESLGTSGRRGSDEALYLSGMSYLKLGNYPKARNCFRNIIKSFRNSKFYQTSLVKLGDAYFLEGDFKKAGTLYKTILKKNIVEDYKPLVYLRLAQIAAKQGKWGREKKYIRIIKDKYPYSIERDYANILETRGYFFTIQVGAFSHKNNAYNLLKELKSKYPAYLAKEKLDSLILYKVRIGKFRKRKYAEKVYHSLIEEGYPARIYP